MHCSSLLCTPESSSLLTYSLPSLIGVIRPLSRYFNQSTLLAMLFILLLLHPVITASTDPSTEDLELPLTCGGVERYIDEHLQGPNDIINPDALVPQETGRASVVPDSFHRFLQAAFNINTTWNIWGPGNATHRGRAQGAAADADGFLPFYINYVIIPSSDRESTHRLGEAIPRVHRLFLNLMKAIPLDDPRLPRIREFGPPDPVTGKPTFIRCKEPKCSRFHVPRQYAGPCFDSDDNYVPEPDITRYMQLEVAMWYSTNTSMVIYVQVDDYGDELCRRSSPIAYAQVCGWIPTNGRPTHGRIVWCKPPKSKDSESVINTLVHETFHIITDGNLLGQHFYDQYGVPPDQWAAYHLKSDNEKMALALGKTYKTESRPWMNRAGVVETKSFSFSILPKVQQAVREHFQCPTAEGAEIFGSVAEDSHWSIRLFPDEILAGTFARIRRISDMTLGVVDSASYYKVNRTYKDDRLLSEPLMYSTPKERGCEVYNKSCYEIFNRIPTDRNMHFLGPYCDPTERVITTRCTFDGRVQLKCYHEPRTTDTTDGCPILGAYDTGVLVNIRGKLVLIPKSIYCREIAGDPMTFTSGGPDSLCVTFLNISSQAQGRPRLAGIRAGCTLHVCHEDYIELNFYRTQCSAEICRTSGAIEQWGTAVPNCDLLITSGSYQCPDIDAVCKSRRPGVAPHRKNDDIDQRPKGAVRQSAMVCNTVIMVGVIWILTAG